MIFEEAHKVSAVVERKELAKTPEKIFNHFMNYGDEVIYVLESGDIYGIITPRDLLETYKKSNKIPVVNCGFSYIKEKNDFYSARIIFEKYPKIHEIAVVKKGKFLGVVKSGYRKTWDEWQDIRQQLLDAMMEMERIEWIKKDIRKLLKLKTRLFVYRYLHVDDMKLTDSERVLYEEKHKIPNGGLSTLTLREQKLFFGGSYSPGYAHQLVRNLEEDGVIYKNGIPEFKDKSNKICTIQNGRRIVPNLPGGGKKKIVMIGPCTIFGAFVSDEQTVEVYLQEKLLENGFSDYEVINSSFTMEESLPRLFNEELSEEDIVIIMTKYFDMWKIYEKYYPMKLKCMESMETIWEEIDTPLDYIFNEATHCNHIVNQKIAEKMFKDLRLSLCKNNKKGVWREKIQDYYISWDVAEYYKRYLQKYSLREWKNEVIGAVVMTCNPFTKGHRYLIEQASKSVDYVYVFVVEENRFKFSFTERFEMVKCGTMDLKNIFVIPSGKFVISERTFIQYFKKEYVQNIEDMDYDVHVFGEVVARELNIKYRFVGEERNDKVTAKYNETMKRILPQYDVEVIEIPRLNNDNDEMISASSVRRYFENGDIKRAKDMLPESTIKYLKGRDSK